MNEILTFSRAAYPDPVRCTLVPAGLVRCQRHLRGDRILHDLPFHTQVSPSGSPPVTSPPERTTFLVAAS